MFSNLSNRIVQSVTAGYFKVQKLIHVGLRGVHSKIETVNMSKMEIQILPALKDNYMYLIIDEATKEAAVVDPVDAERIVQAVEDANVTLKKVLTTHHHWDHAGGNENLVKKYFQPLTVYGGDDRIGALTNKVSDGDSFKIGELDVKCLFTPCHTTGHMCYHVQSPGGDNAVFTGDTLFQGGCGRFFEGTAEQMYDALCVKLSSLPGNTKVFCGHEYTIQNLLYAHHVEPQNKDIRRRIEWAKIKRAEGEPTVPSTIADEKRWNPFMRVHVPNVQKHTKHTNHITTMGILRKEKDDLKA